MTLKLQNWGHRVTGTGEYEPLNCFENIIQKNKVIDE